MIRMLGAHLHTSRSSSSPNYHMQHHAAAVVAAAFDGMQTANQIANASSGNTVGGPQCPHCGKTYSNPSNLRQHVRNVHVSVDKSLWHTCPTCAKKLKTKHYLINHQLQAHGIHQRGTGPLAMDHNETI